MDVRRARFDLPRFTYRFFYFFRFFFLSRDGLRRSRLIASPGGLTAGSTFKRTILTIKT